MYVSWRTVPVPAEGSHMRCTDEVGENITLGRDHELSQRLANIYHAIDRAHNSQIVAQLIGTRANYTRFHMSSQRCPFQQLQPAFAINQGGKGRSAMVAKNRRLRKGLSSRISGLVARFVVTKFSGSSANSEVKGNRTDTATWGDRVTQNKRSRAMGATRSRADAGSQNVVR